MVWLREVKGLATTTILNYKAAMKRPLLVASDLDISSWEFQDLGGALLLEKPRPPPRVLP